MNINTVTLSGNLTKDSELKQTKAGKPLISFSIAVNESVPQGDGTYADRANYFDVTYYGGSPKLQALLRKGQRVAIYGRLRYDSWKDAKTGENRHAVSVVARAIDTLPPAGHAQGVQTHQAEAVPAETTPAVAAPQQPAQPYAAEPAPQRPQQAMPTEQPAQYPLYPTDVQGW
jgi:single-strand DNA-binding protein